jgi:hypothetical protein
MTEPTKEQHKLVSAIANAIADYTDASETRTLLPTISDSSPTGRQHRWWRRRKGRFRCLDHRRRDSSISLRSRRIKLRPTLHVSLPTGFRTVGLALGIILSGMLRGLLGLEFSAATGKQKAKQPAPQTAHCASLAPDGFLKQI